MPPHPLDKQWHVHADSKTHGPYTGHEIRRLVGQGQIEEFDLVYADDGSDWVEARSDPILATLFQRKSVASLQRKPPGYLTPKLRLSLKGALVALLILIFAWVAWPYYALYDLIAALQKGDPVALENRISWDSVRQGLRGDLNAILLKKLSADSGANTGLALLLGPAIINQMVEGYITPQAVANLIRTGKPTTADGRVTTEVATPTDQRRELGFDQVKYAFFFWRPTDIQSGTHS